MVQISRQNTADRIKNLFMIFIAYSFFGWIYEILLGIIVFQVGFINRGFFFGPYLPIYAVGGFLIVTPARKYHIKPRYVFCFTILLCTLLELATSYIMEWTIGEWLWDYKGYFMNFQGRICLSASIRFGFMALAGVYILQPKIEWFIKNCPRLLYNIITYALMICFSVDFVARFFLGSNFTGAVGY